MLSLAVAADDRTGALEVAAACVDAGWAGVPTVPFGVEAPPGAADVLVVDLGSRHLDRDRAAARAVSMMEIAADRHAHKIDSLLRGNWAVELVSRAGTGRRVAVVPALPSQGRWCRGGVVLADGTPVGAAIGSDARQGPRSSRPADHLIEAGASGVDEVAGPAALDRWLRNSGTSFAVCDVTSSDGLFALGRLLATCPDVLVAGTAEAIGSLLVSPTPTRTSPPVPVDGSVVVVCGSLHEAARAQLGVLAGRAIDDVVVIASQGDMTRPVSADAARTIAAALARQAHEAVAARRPAALVIVGGDTAAAVLGDVVLASLGTVGPGAAASSALDGGPLVVTRSGSFGDAQALVDLMRAIMGR